MFVKKSLKYFITLLFITQIFYTTNIFCIEQSKEYLASYYLQIKVILNKVQHSNLKKLTEKIIREAKTKQVLPQEVFEFFQENQANLLQLQNWLHKYKITEFELTDNLFELLRNGFDTKTLSLILDKQGSDKFREKLSKTLYFYIYYVNHDILDDALESGDLTDFNNEQVSRIAFSVFITNPSISYLNELVEAVQQMKYKPYNYAQATLIICQMLLSKKKIIEITAAIPELPDE